MNAINYSELRKNLKTYFDQVYEDHEPVIVTRKNNENIVLISIEDYLYWQSSDKKILKRINLLVKEIIKNPFNVIGKPEPLKFQLQGCWSRRIDQEHRLVYEIVKKELRIISCRYHYKD